MSSELAAALVIGFLGSSHCLVMCGGIVSALQMSMPKQNSYRTLLLQLTLSLGRLTTYTLFGAAVGTFGASAIQLAGASLLWLKLVAGLLLLMMALYISRLWFGLLLIERVGQPIWQFIQPLARKLMPLNSLGKAYLYGICWGLLPCGLVYSTLGWSLASGSGINGGLIMLAFGIGTLPAILITGSAAAIMVKFKNQPLLRYASALALGIYAIYTIWLAITRLVF
mgnify:CR=1 FL=1